MGINLAYKDGEQMTLHDDMSPETIAERHEKREERYEIQDGVNNALDRERETRYEKREDDRDSRRDQESTLSFKLSTVFAIGLGFLTIFAGATNIWVYSAVQEMKSYGNRIAVLETSQAAQDKSMDRFFADSVLDRKEIKARMEIYGENQAIFMAKLGLPAKKYRGIGE